jgi:NAD(P)-dependent dehydrogenase (short-subunit alcohol dehydrogenase family)
MRLVDKHALITGGARGIGLAVAKAFAHEGARVTVADLDLDCAKTAAAGLGEQAMAVHVDIGAPDSIAAMLQTAHAAYGPVDILVNNAGVGSNTPFLEMTLEEWERVLRVNLTGAFLVAQGAARQMAEMGSGGIVNIVSVSGQRGGDGRAAYGAAKAGLELLTKVMAVELAPFGITVNAIAPGPIETEMARFAHDEATRAAYNYLVPMSRYGTPEEIADAAIFLASGESRYVTGHTLNVDGGFLAAGLMFKKTVPGAPR